MEGFLGLYVDPADLVYFEVGSSVFIEDRPYVVRALRRGKKGHEVAFDEVSGRDEAEKIRNMDIYVKERRSLSEDEYWPDQLEGLEVRPGGGVVVAVVSGTAQDRLVIERGGSRFEVPFVEALVPEVDIDAGYVEVVEPPGLTDLV
jgi:16S rRNA processing protein RimM